jgi:MoaA/NifB/PqqE/SkfB family radical SAM enzyme
MQCAHCGFSCTEKGQDMTRKTFLQVLNFIEETIGEAHITLGGGEPTLHPLLFDFIGLAKSRGIEDVCVITNGKLAEEARYLYILTEQNIIHASLSEDFYHERVDHDVYEMFSKKNRLHQVSRISNNGRAKENDLYTEDSCLCPDLTINPNGVIYACACLKHSFGTVLRPMIPDWYEWEGCSERDLKNRIEPAWTA